MKNSLRFKTHFPCYVGLGVLAAIALTTGCKDNTASAGTTPRPDSPVTITPLSSPIGTQPAGTTQEAPATTSNAKSDVSKADQSTAIPLPGQANDHSTLSPPKAQKPAVKP